MRDERAVDALWRVASEIGALGLDVCDGTLIDRPNILGALLNLIDEILIIARELEAVEERYAKGVINRQLAKIQRRAGADVRRRRRNARNQLTFTFLPLTAVRDQSSGACR